MACSPLPTPPAPPPLPGGISLEPPAPPPFPGAPDACCRIIDFPSIPAIVSFPPGTLNPGVMAGLDALMAGVQAFIDGLSFNCPRE